MNHNQLYRNHIKRLIDLVVSIVSIVVLSPLLLAVSLLVRIKLGSPVVFKQPRPGMKEKIFYLYKFRSMTNETGEDGRLLPDAQRLTKFGKLLRATSLDELLELVNIVRGDMSIVGPRPLSIFYLPHYPPEYRARHDVRPGLTGLAQVNGRNNLPWDERFEYDLKYVKNLSFLLDARILLNTVLRVLKRADISVRGTTKVKDYGPYSILKEEGKGGKQMKGMTYSEIGSYFWLDEKDHDNSSKEINWLPPVEDSCFTLSGRGAIDIALRDILKKRKIRKLYAPSYCCVSMLQSFIDRNIPIEFYDVGYQEGAFTYAIPDMDSQSAVLIMSYFGLDSKAEQKMVEELHRKEAVIIEDITHSLLRDVPASDHSDYLVASLRKWFAIPAGGWVGKREGTLEEKPYLDSNHTVREKIAGMREKYDYLTGKTETKENFLLTHARFENDLIHADRLLKIDDTSMKITERTDIRKIVDQRRRNAKTLYHQLKDLDGKILTLPAVDEKIDTLLFFPVFMKTEDRDDLRSYLIEQGIYCPVHWPEVLGASVGVRANELSLICDQRYSEQDMQVIADCIHAWNRSRT